MSNFDKEWAVQKLDMSRRQSEIGKYIYKHLPELHDTEGKYVADVGCGPGDFLLLCRELGHSIQGYDAPPEISQMGEAYIEECRVHIRKEQIPVRYVDFSELCGELSSTKFDVINFRGSIEQCLNEVMVGEEPHKEHHDCKRLDWNQDSFEGICSLADVHISGLMEWSATHLNQGGILLISANGTKSTDDYYDGAVRYWAEKNRLELDYQDGTLLHRWRKNG